ncbi:hypothetical protein C8T65DRAFT_216553 [Cerioporus squamosus]|nr:hypothetical protein C8T65DRAFT_216553 [Cerioporus squamosus]
MPSSSSGSNLCQQLPRRLPAATDQEDVLGQLGPQPQGSPTSVRSSRHKATVVTDSPPRSSAAAPSPCPDTAAPTQPISAPPLSAQRLSRRAARTPEPRLLHSSPAKSLFALREESSQRCPRRPGYKTTGLALNLMHGSCSDTGSTPVRARHSDSGCRTRHSLRLASAACPTASTYLLTYLRACAQSSRLSPFSLRALLGSPHVRPPHRGPCPPPELLDL